MRHFRQLDRKEIAEIIALHHEGVSKIDLSVRFECDPSTISYHIRKYERSYPEERSFYATLKMRIRKTCSHPSARCTICTIMWDQLARQEREEIAALRKALEGANSRLRVAGLAVETVPYNGVNESA